MSTLKAQWQRLADRVDAMSLRERALIFLAVAMVLIVLVNTVLIDPLLVRHKKLQQQIAQTQEKTNAMQTQIQTLVKTWNVDPDIALRSRLAQLREQSEQTGKTLEDIQSGLVPPQRMPALLEDILQHNRSLRLVALKTLPVTVLGKPEATAAGKAAGEADKPVQAQKPATPESIVYKHGVEITVEGSYLDLLRYLTEIESLPWHMFWGKADLDVEKYPKVTLTLRLYTLSLDKAWLAI
ncbi:MAG TPA: type II secretion system protein GspM [Sulfuriferula sp.]|nr:type II secretion system protein GspM [Sulfuriferula sp.]